MKKRFLLGFTGCALLLGVVFPQGLLADVTAHQSHNNFGFMINGMEELPDEVYYRCDAIESAVRQMLGQLGGENVQVQCAGGLDDFGPYSPPSVTVQFDSIRLIGNGPVVSAVWKTVELRDFENCDLARQLLRNLSAGFETRGFTGSSVCMNPSDGYNYTFEVLSKR